MPTFSRAGFSRLKLRRWVHADFSQKSHFFLIVPPLSVLGLRRLSFRCASFYCSTHCNFRRSRFTQTACMRHVPNRANAQKGGKGAQAFLPSYYTWCPRAAPTAKCMATAISTPPSPLRGEQAALSPCDIHVWDPTVGTIAPSAHTIPRLTVSHVFCYIESHNPSSHGKPRM